MQFPIDDVRAEFPSLELADDGLPRIYLDNPAGTQVPLRVIQRIAECMIGCTANLGGHFVTSLAAQAVVDDARMQMRHFLNASSPSEIIVGASMTALTFRIARALAARFGPGDEIIVTQMDHDGNVAPWLTVARERGCTVRFVPFDADTWRIEPSALDAVLTSKTRLVALSAASNLTGSINDVKALVRHIHDAGALAYVDAVQLAPHALIDVRDLGCDFLACSSYKFFGPHLGIVYGREALLEHLRPEKVRPATDELPWRFDLGTPQIELFAGLAATIGYLQELGMHTGGSDDARASIAAAFDAAVPYETELTVRLIDGLSAIDGVRILGITDPAHLASRVPTVSFVHGRATTDDVARALARENIFVWSGNNYALEVVRALGIDQTAGVVRIGAAHYNTAAEIDAAMAAVERAVR